MSPVHLRLNPCSDGDLTKVHKVGNLVQLSQRFDNPECQQHLVEVNLCQVDYSKKQSKQVEIQTRMSAQPRTMS